MNIILDNPVALIVSVTTIVCIVLLLVSGAPIVWIRAYIADCPVSLMTIIGMRMRGVPAGRIVRAYILCKKAGMIYPIERLEAQYLATPESFTEQITAMVKARRDS